MKITYKEFKKKLENKISKYKGEYAIYVDTEISYNEEFVKSWELIKIDKNIILYGGSQNVLLDSKHNSFDELNDFLSQRE